MKKWIAALLALSMLAGAPVSAMAEGQDHPAVSSGISASSSESAPEGSSEPSSAPSKASVSSAESKPEESPASSGSTPDQKAQTSSPAGVKLLEQAGGVLINVYLDFPAAKLEKVVAALEPVDRKSIGVALERMETEEESPYVLRFRNKNNLKAGNYRLVLSGANFVRYEQEIQIFPGMNTRLSYHNSHIDTGVQGRGIFVYGDFDGSGNVGQEDADILIRNLDQAVQETDLNRDGKTDLLDLTLFCINLEKQQTMASQLESLQPELIAAKPEMGTQMEGDFSTLLDVNSRDTVAFSRKSGEAISKQAPVEFSMELPTEVGIEGILLTPGKENAPAAGEIILTDKDGKEVSFSFGQEVRMMRSADPVEVRADGSIVLRLGNQLAIKKVTFRITATTDKNANLAEISTVEFLNDTEKLIPPPELNIPKNIQVVPENKQLQVSWSKEPNVIFYEVEVRTKDGEPELQTTYTNSIIISQYGSKKMTNGETYFLRVRSVNGEWFSPFSDEVSGSPVVSKAPDAPENIVVAGGYRKLSISWKKMEDTDFYTLYYRLKGETEFQKVEKIEKNSYALIDLEHEREYELYLTGHNEKGESPASKLHVGKTQDARPTLPNYKKINLPKASGEYSEHIVNVTTTGYVPSEYPAEFNPAWLVDGDYSTHWTSSMREQGGAVTVEFDQAYEMDRMILSTRLEDGFILPDGTQGVIGSVAKCHLTIWDESGTEHKYNSVNTDPRLALSSAGSRSSWIRFPRTKVKKLQVSFSSYYTNYVSMSELHFYYYDSLEDDIDGLYTDALHLVLADTVDKAKLQALRDRLETPDPVSGEKHPNYAQLVRELDYAESLLDGQAAEVIPVDQTLSTRGNQAGFSFTLSTFQPLGVTVKAGETLTIFAGREGANVGDSLPINIIATQIHGESSTWKKSVKNGLVVGKNEITIPAVASVAEEQGGSLYLQFTGAVSAAAAPISVRVSGGSPIPTLELRGVTDEAEINKRITEYLADLKTHVESLESTHAKEHQVDGYNHTYKDASCILNLTEIGMQNMLFSIPAKAAWEGLGKTADSAKLKNSIDAMEQMIALFYQQKGLDPEADASSLHRYPDKRLNIRYATMFAGAFMYAGGEHIGIEYPESRGMMGGVPITFNSEDGSNPVGQNFGWGIAHEIGHVIDQLAYAEITNNIFAQFAKSRDTADTSRIPYVKVYEKVTSQSKGFAANVFTTLGMYWQLHLAYDPDYLYKPYDSHEAMLQNNFFARFYTYLRDPSSAPNGLTLAKDNAQDTMRLACAAAGKDLTEYFIRWGQTPDADTLAYAGQFPKETRAIWYLNDGAREYQLKKGAQMPAGTSVTASQTVSDADGTVTLAFSSAGGNAMLGYEILRNGVPVGFVEEGTTTFVDSVGSLSNRVLTYSVIGYDKYLNETVEAKLAPVKVKSSGILAKDHWELSTNMTSADDVPDSVDENNPDGTGKTSAIFKAADNDEATVYTGQASSGDPYILIDLKESNQLSAWRYTTTTNNAGYQVYVSSDQTAPAVGGSSWTKVLDSKLETAKNGEVVYFAEKGSSLLNLYDAHYVLIQFPGSQELSFSEIGLVGKANDNIELEQSGIGLLSADYQADGNVTIPKGSLVFTGTYSGHPAYNVVKLLDGEGNYVVGKNGEGHQMIFAEVPKDGPLSSVSAGTWVYYIEPDQIPAALPKEVYAELYRVDDALTNEGERLVSDTFRVTVPTALPQLTIQK